MAPEIVSLVGQMGMAGIFFYLYWRADQRLQIQGIKHDADIARLYDMRIAELKQMTSNQIHLSSG